MAVVYARQSSLTTKMAKKYLDKRRYANAGPRPVPVSIQNIGKGAAALVGGVGFGHYMGAAAVSVKKQLRAEAKRKKERKPPQIDRPLTRKEKWKQRGEVNFAK